MNSLELLKHYVEASEPTLNSDLRKGKVTQDALLFDTLFELENVPSKLYRWVPECYIKCENGIYKDLAYFSCSKDVDSFLNHVDGDKMACFVIEMPTKAKCINVQKLLPCHNEEGEYILPRNAQLQINNQKTIESANLMERFIREENGEISAKWFKETGISCVSVYYMVMA